MPKSENPELWNKIRDAREACAGSNWQPKNILLGRIHNAIGTATTTKASKKILMKLKNAYTIIQKLKKHDDRLAADDILCDILNNDIQDPHVKR